MRLRCDSFAYGQFLKPEYNFTITIEEGEGREVDNDVDRTECCFLDIKR